VTPSAAFTRRPSPVAPRTPPRLAKPLGRPVDLLRAQGPHATGEEPAAQDAGIAPHGRRLHATHQPGRSHGGSRGKRLRELPTGQFHTPYISVLQFGQLPSVTSFFSTV